MDRRNFIGPFLSLVAGCARLPAGQPDAVAGRPTTVYLVRGFQDWYSTGVDQLAAELSADGHPTATFREEQWSDLADALLAAPAAPVVLIGFSYGADDVIAIARRLGEHGRPVPLLVTIDPVTPARVPASVARAVNFYAPNPPWDLLPFLRGVRVEPDDGARPPQNVDVTTDVDVSAPTAGHSTIAADPAVHRAVQALVGATLK